ncbi:hypothetical protein HYQ44_008929 [Verticillium longisporum]|nr:hypothetical protein HYQ44_008929 [Verticillium longisporum]
MSQLDPDSASNCCYRTTDINKLVFVTTEGSGPVLDTLNWCFIDVQRDVSDPDNCEAAKRSLSGRVTSIEIAESLRQSDRAGQRSNAIPTFGKYLRRGDRFQPTWDAIGGATGLASLMVEFSVRDVRAICHRLGRTATAQNARDERRIAMDLYSRSISAFFLRATSRSFRNGSPRRYDDESRDEWLGLVIRIIQNHAAEFKTKLTLETGGLIRYIIQRWVDTGRDRKVPEKYLAQVLTLREPNDRNMLNTIYITLDAPKRLNPITRYQLLRLLFQHMREFRLDLEDQSPTGLAKLKAVSSTPGTWPIDLLLSIDKVKAFDLVEKLEKLHPGRNFLINNGRWVEEFLKRKNFTLTPGERLPVGPVSFKNIAFVFSACTTSMPLTLFDTLREVVLVNIAPSSTVENITEMVKSDSKLVNSNAGKHWLRQYDNKSEVLDFVLTRAIAVLGQKDFSTGGEVTVPDLQQFLLRSQI